MKIRPIYALLMLLISFSANAAGFNFKEFSLLAIQERGRIKPVHTFAQESILYITGKRSWNKQDPTESLFSLFSAFEQNWLDKEFILVNYKPLKVELGLDENRKYFSPEELSENSKLRTLSQQAYEKSENKEPLTEIEKKVNDVNNRIGLVRAIVGGQAWTLLPNPEGIEANWYPVSSLMGADPNQMPPYASDQMEQLSTTLRTLVTSYTEGKTENWNKALGDFSALLKEVSNGKYPSLSKLKAERHYNLFRPFRWAWVAYLLAFLLLLGFIVTKHSTLKLSGILALAAAFGLHCYGFGLRMYIAGRPPVTNMYESVIWVSWGCILFAAFIFMAYRQTVILASASVFAVVGLVLADNLPSILDPSINPLEPVLRSNFWLTIHVLTITISYAAFALSLCLGNVVLGNHLFTPTKTDRMKQYSLYMYRAMQIGVVLLAAGTILGGVWADYSWGRFWGWDPKEVWALIALLLYLAVLHGRFSGWLRGFGFAAVTVVSFLGVLMAWYGVNFVLGAGLHSYGFGSGGKGYVGAYILAQLGFIFAAYLRHRKARAEHKVDTAIFPKGHR